MAKLAEKFKRIAAREATLGFDPLGTDEARLAQIRLEDIEADPSQPRKDPGDLQGLIDSVREQGIIHPLVVSPLDETRYLLVAGERRYAAAKELGLRTVPALIRTVKQHQRLEIQLIENLHRKDLDPFEEAAGYQRLIDEFNLIQENVGQRVGKSRTYITQTLRLNTIPPDIRKQCQSSDIPLSRDTLYNIAKQDTPDKMLAVLQDAQSGLSFEERRDRARKGEPRPSRTPQRPYKPYATSQNAVVTVRSTNYDALTPERIVTALQEALDKARAPEPH